MSDPWPRPEGQLCQAKDEYGIVDFDGQKVWGLINPENGCKHPGTVRWGDLHDWNHGGGAWFCEHHALDEQIAHAEERVRALAELKAQRVHACEGLA
jgi:hypothetical protein